MELTTEEPLETRLDLEAYVLIRLAPREILISDPEGAKVEPVGFNTWLGVSSSFAG